MRAIESMATARTIGCLVLGVLVAVSGCDQPGEGPPGSVARDSAGLEVVESSAPAWGADTTWSVTAEPAVSIGVVDGPPEYQLSDVADVLRLPDGRILVADGGTSELRYYGPDGEFLRSVGARGEGPEEFMSLDGVALDTDTLLVYDREFARLSVRTVEGQLHETRGLEATGGPMLGPDHFRLAGPVADRGLLFLPWSYPSPPMPSPTRYWDSIPNLLYSARGEVRDTLGGFSGMDMYGTPDVGTRLQFGAHTSADLHADRLYIGHAHDYEIEVYAPDGSLERLIRRDAEPVSGDEAVDRLVSWAERRAEEQDASPGALEEFRRRLRERPHAETLPHYEDIVVDTLGHVWVQRYRPRYAEGPADWDVYDPDGRWLGTLELPAGLEVHQIGRDWMLGVWSDEFEVEHVRLYQVSRDGG